MDQRLGERVSDKSMTVFVQLATGTPFFDSPVTLSCTGTWIDELSAAIVFLQVRRHTYLQDHGLIMITGSEIHFLILYFLCILIEFIGGYFEHAYCDMLFTQKPCSCQIHPSSSMIVSQCREHRHSHKFETSADCRFWGDFYPRVEGKIIMKLFVSVSGLGVKNREMVWKVAPQTQYKQNWIRYYYTRYQPTAVIWRSGLATHSKSLFGIRAGSLYIVTSQWMKPPV